MKTTAMLLGAIQQVWSGDTELVVAADESMIAGLRERAIELCKSLDIDVAQRGGRLYIREGTISFTDSKPSELLGAV